MKKQQNFKLAEDLASLIPRFHQKFIHHLQFPIPPNHFFTLVCLYDHGTQTITEISNRLLISKQQMSPIVEKLLKSGSVKKEADPADKRSSKISMTKAGYQILENHHNEVRSVLADKIKDLDKTDAEELNHVLNSFFHLFNRLP